MEKAKKKKGLIIVLVVIVALLVCVSIGKFHEARIIKQIQKVCDACELEQFDVAMSCANALPDEYQAYYVDFVAYSMELENWSGTGEELFLWLQRLLADVAQKRYTTFPFPDYIPYSYSENNYDNCKVWEITDSVKERCDSAFGNDKTAFQWYPQFIEICTDYYSEYFELLIENRDIFLIETEGGTVEGPVSAFISIDKRMDSLYKRSVGELNDLIETYDLQDEWLEVVESEVYNFAARKKDYLELHAITPLYEEALSQTDKLGFKANKVGDLYETLDDNIDAVLGKMNLSQQLDSAILHIAAGSSDERYEYYASLSKSSYELVNMICRIFPNATPNIDERTYFDVYEVANKVAERNE